MISWERLVDREGAANDYYITLVKKDSDKFEALKTESERICLFIRQEPENERYYKKLWRLNQDKIDKYKFFGYKGLTVDKDNLPNLYKAHVRLSDMFLRKYGRYRLAYSSYVEFENQLQLIFDTVCEYYEDRLNVSNKQRELFNKEFNEKNPFASRSESDMWATGTGENKAASMADIESGPPTYTGLDKSENTQHSSSTASDTSLITKMASMSAFEGLQKPMFYKDYLDEFAPLFQTIIW